MATVKAKREYTFTPVTLEIVFKNQEELDNFKNFCGQNESVVPISEEHLNKDFSTVANTLATCFFALDGIKKEK